MDYSNVEYIKIQANDENQYFLSKDVANLCGQFREFISIQSNNPNRGEYITITLNMAGPVIETIIQYLHYKYKYLSADVKTIPKFDIQPSLALQVLNASIELNI
ncbi:hypothetical protein ABPG74_001970 [Tetrahymena malaccensis]